jgi:prepilin-type N-terminal cleavage/methylation domain-containing protein/prepilin-type processing-associated H-X9-DG protein
VRFLATHLRYRRGGFTLIEVLTALFIIGLLIALLLPAVISARRQAQTVQCAANLRQVTLALINYATEHGGAFPPNSVQIEQYWFQEPFVGRYIPTHVKLPDNSIAGGVMVCPSASAAEPDVLRSYAMNVFASGYVSSFVRQAVESDPPRAGKMFKLGASPGSQLILAAEAMLELEWPNPFETDASGNPKVPVGKCPEAAIGFTGLPGQRFGAGGGAQRGNRYGWISTQVNFVNHRVLQKVEPLKKGRANFGFLDGHVAGLSPADVADFTTGKSRYEALWSPIDRDIDQVEPGAW